MGKAVIIYGKSGSGKSRSLRNFSENEIFFVNVEGKDLPFRKKFNYVYRGEKYAKIKEGLLNMPTKTAVIDDAGYLLTNMFMSRHSSGLKGNAVFELYNDIGDEFWALFKFIKKNLSEDVIVYIMMHEDSNDYGAVKLKTIGKLLDDKVCIEGMVTVVLRCMSDNGRHFFKTHTDGLDITKSPEEMFVNDEIENDLKAVDTVIREFYGIGGSTNAKTE